MNKIYALVWNQAQGCWNVAHEGARRRRRSGSGKSLIVAAASVLALACMPSAFALPTGGVVVSGSADISTQGNHMSVNQNTDKLITNWKDFNVQTGQSVTFNQPTNTSIALNRVIGVNGSMIMGTINANGQVFLVNPNGVVFGNNAQVNVGGLVVSTQGIGNEQFNAGNYQFSGTSKARVVNLGKITAADGGSVALLAADVLNNGTITAQNGRVALGAGEAFTVSFDGNNLLDLQIDSAALNALVANGGLLKADGGHVLMTAKSAGAMTQTVVNNTGTIEANTLSQKAGRITLDGGDVGMVNVDGALLANASDEGNGGVIETRGGMTWVQKNARVSTQANNGQTGTWKIESEQVAIGGPLAYFGINHGDTLSRNLATTNIELASSKGDVVVDGAINWSSGNQLTLSAAKDIQLNGNLTANGAKARAELNANGRIELKGKVQLTGSDSSLGLNHGADLTLGKNSQVTLSGSGAGFDANGAKYEVIQNAAQLQAIDKRLDGRYVLGAALNGSGSLTSIGGADTFTGVFNGLGNTISGFTVNSNGGNGGLFASSSGSISNFKLASLTVKGPANNEGASAVGGLVGSNTGSISNVQASNLQVRALDDQDNQIGALVGINHGGSIEGSSVSGSVAGNTSTSAAGGLVGLNTGSVSNSHANVRVGGSMGGQAPVGMGGLVGINQGGSIADSSSSGMIGLDSNAYAASRNLGGLVGYNQNGSILRSSASGTVVGYYSNNAGGLVGFNHSGRITDSSASAMVVGLGMDTAGGLVGLNQNGVLSNVKATGVVHTQFVSSVGSVVGKNVK
ncbi:filamentous hemagglutinin N-terminal domain-containing protein [Pseudomonas protegens]|uniref:two-partner secretion domain-containing protein n=1 Tax=Pseudomonas protegens TaxID=380021 RepID=UPI001B311C16|nr:filamentous hemagglutinin N-terminal domain-containing protein [Pseudomonas protegens]QTU05525.1 filamentous hemagglutinin N-terminal domain-containing protein [Pseudomonas protegens]QTU11836.1 filamentous hemagglutinin N-terminal domain-containing protein [Pseudomonas protegens]QTU40786.1 filamentous hemagglutinin N-terminal domain-containing protein [Pseudomonas protegens]